jgi:hypothetical protein
MGCGGSSTAKGSHNANSSGSAEKLTDTEPVSKFSHLLQEASAPMHTSAQKNRSPKTPTEESFLKQQQSKDRSGGTPPVAESESVEELVFVSIADAQNQSWSPHHSLQLSATSRVTNENLASPCDDHTQVHHLFGAKFPRADDAFD